MSRVALLSALYLTALVVLVPKLEAQDRGRRRGFAPPPSPVMTALDKDGNGALSEAEVHDAEGVLLELDKNGDGNLTKSELAPPENGRGPANGGRGAGGRGAGGRGGMPGFLGMGMPAGPALSALDLDQDGELFEDEVTDATESLLALDADGDDALSAEELRAGSGSGRGGFGGFGGGRGGFTGGRGGGGRGGFGGRGRGDEDRVVPEPSELEFKDGVAEIPDMETFHQLSYQGPEVLIDTYLAHLEFVKFTITGANSDDPKIYLMNTETHRGHPMFAGATGVGSRRGMESGNMMGVLVYRPMLKSPSGNPGYFDFEFEPNDAYPFERIKLAFDLLNEHAPIVDGNLAYRPLPAAMEQTGKDLAAYEDAGLPVFRDEDLYGDIGYLPLHKAESYGRLRLMKPDERPGVRDIVIYPTLPNEMPRVAGILTGVQQTPLSHVNLRAIQDDVPNAFLVNVTGLPDVQALIGKYVYYKVAAEGYELREASAQEVEDHFAAWRPREPQDPPRDLSVTAIRSLDDIGFEDASNVGVKASNMATLRTLGFDDTVVRSGYAVPFSFYDAFMKHNGFYARAEAMMGAEGFQEDANLRKESLKDFRKALRKGEMPGAMREALAQVHERFPAGSSIRCRSSTNNEDLPGFSGAGLYDSYSHHADEGHLSKSIQQVFASLWNFRAYEEREFHRINHMKSAMGVLLHRNFTEEQANGVAVTDDILYQPEHDKSYLYYVNAQVGEDLVTNPESDSVPEEILLAPRNPASDRVVRQSNRVPDDTAVLGEEHRMELRRCLRRIHKEFRGLYQVQDDAPFAMEIEFKITKAGDLSIKQARPWVY